MGEKARRRLLAGLLAAGAALAQADGVAALAQADGVAAQANGPGDARTLTLAANAAWRDTGIEIRRDEAWRVVSTGSWSAGPLCGQTDASGLAVEHLLCMKGVVAADFPVPEARIGALVGRIGPGGKPFLIGGRAGFIATEDGNLFLRSNDHDGYLADNQGAIEISLRRLGGDGSGDEGGGAAVARTAAVPAPREPAPASPGPAAGGFADIHFGAYHALVVGNDRYRNLKPLRTARNDARAVAELLRTVYGFRVTVLLDATRTGILGALAELRAALGPDDNLLIYYAGHGVVDSVTEQGYWLPVDAENRNPANWISNNDLTNMLRGIAARHVMVVADSCYSGTLVRAASARLATGRDRRAWVRRMLKKRARTALVSGGLEPVLDGGGGDHSVFAGAFLSALRENPDVVDGQALFDAIKRPVVLNAEQTPEYSDIRHAGHEGGEFLFVRRRGR